MKTAKERTGKPDPKKHSPVNKSSRDPVDLAEIRQQITNLVGNGALGMVETTIEQVGKGHYLGMKYLIGLYPATVADESPAEDSMAATLLRRLGLPESPMQEQKVTKDIEMPNAVSDDGLE
ncbi:MAG: hypothetical protein WB755_13825 [Terriglobales bacterium]